MKRSRPINTKIIPMLLAIWMAAIAISPATTFAQARSEYRVEMQVLRHLNNEARSFEAPTPVLMPEPVSLPDGSKAANNKDERERSVAWRGLRWADFQLKQEEYRLKRSRDFRPLLHLGWTQAALDSDEAGWVPIRGQAEDGTRVDGRARLTVNRYLHLRLEITANIPEKGEFRMQQSRRMKSGELHYFDHPEFGVLVLIEPEPEPKPEPEPGLKPEPQSGVSPGQNPNTG